MKRKLFEAKRSLAAIALFAVALTAVYAQNNNSALYGTWRGGAGNDNLEFTAPNKWEYMGFIEGTYTYDGTTLTLTYDGSPGTSRATISGNTLNIGNLSGRIDSSINSYIPGTYQKTGAAQTGPQSGTGWPSAAQLAEYGISGLSQPSGASNIGWRLQPDMYAYPVIVIWFNGAAAADTAIKNYFRGWNVRYDDSTRTATDIGYERGGTRVGYKYDGREVMITAGKAD